MDHMPRDYSMSLGAGETTPLRLTAAYAMLVDGGKRLTPTLIDSVQDRNGKTIFRADQRPCDGLQQCRMEHISRRRSIPDNREQIADPQSTYQLVQMMQGVVQRGTGAAVKAVGKPIAGKTGTTSDWRDAWFVGFTPNLAAGVYIGYDDHGQPRPRRAGGGGRRAGVPRFHDRGAEGRAADRIPHPAGLADVPGQPRHRCCRPAPARRRSGRPTSPAPSPARTVTSGCMPGAGGRGDDGVGVG